MAAIIQDASLRISVQLETLIYRRLIKGEQSL
jgi:hypothetical protein